MPSPMDNHHILNAENSIRAVGDLLGSIRDTDSDLHIVSAEAFTGLLCLIHEELERGLKQIAG